MKRLIQSCESYKSYPRNIIKQKLSLQRADAYRESLRSEEPRLFEKEARVNVLDGNNDEEGIERRPKKNIALADTHFVLKGLHRTVITSLDELKKLIRQVISEDNDEPACRFM